MASLSDKERLLAELHQRVNKCRQCSLGNTRTNLVFGSGSAGARLMFVGEAPGYHEDQQGVPFVGQAGKLLEKLLARIALKREDIYIANVLKCRPPANRDPQADEIDLCRKFLDEQIAIIKPAAICTMGNFSTKLLSGKSDGITRVRGQAQPFPGLPEVSLFPVFHPAAALYTPANLATLERDFDTLGNLFCREMDQPLVESGKIRSQSVDEINTAFTANPPKPQHDPEQLGLF